ncbi:MAG: HAMP domain-containing sensor histidine kinase [Chryseolinea sp.]
MASNIFNAPNYFRFKISFVILFLILSYSTYAQEKVLVQVKAFDQQLKALTNLSVSLNGKEFIPIEKANTFHEIEKNDLPPKSIRVSNEELEAESWVYSKGVLEIMIRKKNYKVYILSLRTADHKAIIKKEVKFSGLKNVTATTNEEGNAKLALALNETIQAAQFTVAGYTVKKITSTESERILILEPIPQKAKEDPIPTNQNLDGAFDLSRLDSIKSLTEFYSVFKNYEIAHLDEVTKKKIDDKFAQLVRQLNVQQQNKMIGKISDSSFVKSDIQNLLAQAQLESTQLDHLQNEFDAKIRIINAKLSNGASSLSPTERAQLLEDLGTLENVLKENENKFYENLSSYRLILSSMKSTFSDVQNLENQLVVSESQRKEDQRVFRQKILIVLTIAIAFGILVIFLIYLRIRLTKQTAELVIAHTKIKSVNENLESLVHERTRLLKNAHREMDIFLYRASHDLRSPICSILGLSNIAQHSHGEELMALISRVSQTATRMDRMLNKLRIISEVNHPTNFSSINLFQLINGVMKEFTYTIHEHTIQVNIECDPELDFDSYSDLIETILRHLVDNALYFSSVEKKRTAMVQVKAGMDDNQLYISIYDNGIGIENDVVTKLWDMFFVGSTHSKGNGLGLYVVAKAVRALNGNITVQTEYDSHTIFTVMLPVNTRTTTSLLGENHALELVP